MLGHELVVVEEHREAEVLDHVKIARRVIRRLLAAPRGTGSRTSAASRWARESSVHLDRRSSFLPFAAGSCLSDLTQQKRCGLVPADGDPIARMDGVERGVGADTLLADDDLAAVGQRGHNLNLVTQVHLGDDRAAGGVRGSSRVARRRHQSFGADADADARSPDRVAATAHRAPQCPSRP